MQPLVSVVIPAYNASLYIAEAIESIFSQGYPNLEIIVINDGSTDATEKILGQFGERIKIISQENKGQSAARNAGIRVAQGTVIALLDADDVWPSGRLATMMPYLKESDMVRGMAQRIDEQKKVIGEPFFTGILVGACLYTASVFARVGFFDEQMRQGEDMDWNLRFEELGGKEKRIKDVTLYYRRHETNLTNSREVMEKGQLDAFRRRLERTRNKIR